MTQQQARHGALPNGFIAEHGAPPPNHLPLKVGYRRRVRPVCELQLDGWLLRPETLRSIVSDLRQKAQAAAQARHFAQRDQVLDAAADALADFVNARRLFGEKVAPWQ
jgi:hypothetical protein